MYDSNEFGSIVGIKTGISSATTPTYTAPSAVKSEDCSASLPTTASDTTLYCYDEFDRLSRQRSPGAGEQQQFEYDGMDRRDNRTDHIGGTTDKSGYKYVGATSTLSGQQVATGPTASVLISYDRDSANRPLGVTLQASGSSTQITKTYATDANGNPTGLEETNGSVPGANRYVYDPYGDLDTDANAGLAGDAATNPLRFNGFDYDSSIKTYDMQARDYRPSVGRFLQNDRYESAQSDLSLIADPLTQNRYDFGGADPVSNVEFDGHISPDSVDRNNDVAASPERNPSRGPIKPVSHVERANEIPRSTRLIHKQQPAGINDVRTDAYEKKAAPKAQRSSAEAVLKGAWEQTKLTAVGGGQAALSAAKCQIEGALCGVKRAVGFVDAASHPNETADKGKAAVNDTVRYYTEGGTAEGIGKGGVSVLTLVLLKKVPAAAGAASGGESAAAPALLRGTNASGELTSRSSFRKGTVRNAWEDAEPGPTGGRLCPTCGSEVHAAPGVAPRDWDASHFPSWTNRLFPPNATRQDVIDNYNEGVSLECPSCNRSAGNDDSRFLP